jgi:hypothetical protein
MNLLSILFLTLTYLFSYDAFQMFYLNSKYRVQNIVEVKFVQSIKII